MSYDIIVIGGGPAGMMAAGRAGELGARVLLLEKNSKLGLKLLITGKGRCNITNYEINVRSLTEKFGPQGKFLYSVFSRFGVQSTIDFFENFGVKTKIERGNRVFPQSDKSADILKALIEYLKKGKVEVRTNIEVKAIEFNFGQIKEIILADGKKIEAKNYAICTGGKSYPKTGSTGQGYDWLKILGHKVKPPRPALAPIIVKESWIKELEGLSLKNVGVSFYQSNKKIDSRFGEALFTDNGLSGPIILDMSKKIGEFLKRGPVLLKIDFKPALDFKTLDKRVQKDFQKFNNKMFKNSLDLLLPKKLIPIFVKLSGINPDKKINLVTKIERKRIIQLLKNFSLQVKRIDNFSKAIITSGGCELKEVDPKTMRSKIISNLFLAGEILDLDGPTGGYNLQVCWSTGFLVGDNFK